MLTFSHLLTFRGTPPEGVWYQDIDTASYVKAGVYASVAPDGRATVYINPGMKPVRSARHTSAQRAFEWAEGEVEWEIQERRRASERAFGYRTLRCNFSSLQDAPTPTHIAIGQVWRSRDGDKAMVTEEAGGCYRFRVGGASLDVGSSGKILDYGGCTYVGRVEIK